MKTKRCKSCEKVKPISCFYTQKRKSGNGTWPFTSCKPCYNESRMEYRTKNKESRHIKWREWVENNRDKVNGYSRSWWRKRRPLSSAYYKAYTARILRGRLSAALKQTRNKKSSRALDLLGCTIDEFKKWIESQFKPGMSWENHGYHTWHVDHIRPVSSFDLSDPVQQAECFHYTNHQPLWALENLKKGKRLDVVPYSIQSNP